MIGVFGASGFIGKSFIDHLVRKNVPFKIFTRSDFAYQNCDVVNMDFSNPETYSDSLADLTKVVLLVSASNPSTFADSVSDEIVHNLLPYSQFLKVISNSNVNRIVFLSSGGAVYGVPHETEQVGIIESHAKNPISPYGLGKLYIEQLFRFYAVKADWTYTILRPSNPVGFGQSAAKGQGLIAKAIEVGLNGEAVQIWGDGTAVRDYFDVRDLCTAIDTVLNSNKIAVENSAFNVSGGQPMSVNEILSMVEDLLGRTIVKEYVEMRSVDVPYINIDSSRLREVTDWKPKFKLYDSIKNMIDSKKEN